jgi:hypothetical protein
MKKKNLSEIRHFVILKKSLKYLFEKFPKKISHLKEEESYEIVKISFFWRIWV